MNKKQNADIDEELDEFDDAYDSHGNCVPGGIYDAGGHIIPDRYADLVDYMQDKIRDI